MNEVPDDDGSKAELDINGMREQGSTRLPAK